jgi:hypothetical protein
METRRNDADRRAKELVTTIFEQVQVYQGSGQTVDGNDLTDKLQAAGKASVVRPDGEFDLADQDGWDRVVERARKGETQPLKAIAYEGDTDRHPVCAQALKQLGAGRSGADVKDYFDAPPFGWPRDVIDGALYPLLAGGHLLATDKLGCSVDAWGLERRQINRCHFKPETVTITPVQMRRSASASWTTGTSRSPSASTRRAPTASSLIWSAAP